MSQKGKSPLFGKKRPEHSKRMSGKNSPFYIDGRSSKIYFCKCGHKIKSSTFLRGTGKCHSCDTKSRFELGVWNWKGKNHPRYGKEVSIKTRIKISRANSGKNSYLWQGGKTSKNKKLRNSLKMKIWREEIFKRDDYTCQKCYKRGIELEAHHIKAFSKFPKLRFVISNGITLCKKCHKKTKTYLNKKK
jgi:5-methylcytosine-specific restriction endonuclease McrA